MRRGTPKSLKRGGRTRSAASKTKPRAQRKDASSAALAAQLAAKTRELNEALISRPQPRRSCRSSRVRQARCSRCSTPCSNGRRVCARRLRQSVFARRRRRPARTRSVASPPMSLYWQRDPASTWREPWRPASMRHADQNGDACRRHADGTRAIWTGNGRFALVDTAGARTFYLCADAEGRRGDRRVRTLPPGGATVHRTSRSNWSATSPIRRSSPSRTRACSTSCANR